MTSSLSSSSSSHLNLVTDIVKQADTVFILAGAGLSADVGIPTYWSENGSYGEATSQHGYTALQHADASLWWHDTTSQIEYYAEKRANLASIDFADSIYGCLLEALANKDYFCVTSNIDSGFYRAGFDEEKLFEVHGSYRNSQCVMDPIHGIFPAVDGETLGCPVCSMPTRPNALFFNDESFNPEIMHKQQDRFNQFIEKVEKVASKSKVAVLEFGVGTTVPRIRQMGNRLYRDLETADYLHVNIEPKPEFLFGEACSFPNKEQWVQMSATDFIQGL